MVQKVFNLYGKSKSKNFYGFGYKKFKKIVLPFLISVFHFLYLCEYFFNLKKKKKKKLAPHRFSSFLRIKTIKIS